MPTTRMMCRNLEQARRIEFRRPWADEDDNEINEFDANGEWFDWDRDQWGAFKSYTGGYTRVYTEYGEDATQKVSMTSKEEPVARRDAHVNTANVESTRKYINQCAQDSRTIDFKVDSGAAVSVAPIDLFKEYKLHPTYESENKIPYTVANGQKVYEAGVRWPVFREVTTGKLLRFPVRAANVRSNLLAPFALANMGIRTVLDDSESHLLDKKTKQQIHLKWRGGTPIVRVEVLQPTGEDREILNMEDSSSGKVGSVPTAKGSVPTTDTPGASSSSAPFQRQAQKL